MRDLLKRLERMERTALTDDDYPVVIQRFVPGEPDTIRSGDLSGEAIRRQPGEALEAFEARAIRHFAPTRLPGCGLVLLAMAEPADASFILPARRAARTGSRAP